MNQGTPKMSVLQLTLLTAVHMMGSGIILLPTQLAQVGALSIISWLITILGSLALAYGFSQCGMYSQKPGGMGGFAEYSFGKAGNFLTNYTYGISLIMANTAIAVSAVGYGASFLNCSLSPLETALWTVITLWIGTGLNFGGAKITGRIGSSTVWGIVIPILIISTVGLFYFSPELYVKNWNVHDMNLWDAAKTSIAMTLWGFLGLESACANAEAVDNPERNVPIAILGSTLLVAVIYIVSTNMIFGIIPAADLANSNAPFGLAFAMMFNPLIGKIVMGVMVLACFGSLLGWQFTIANVFRSAAQSGLFPSKFKIMTSKRVPIFSMIVITTCQSLLSMMTISPSLSDQFEMLVNLAVVINIVPYLLSMSALMVILKAADRTGMQVKRSVFVAGIASIYSIYALYATGMESVTYGALVTFSGWILYGYVSPKFDLALNKWS